MVTKSKPRIEIGDWVIASVPMGDVNMFRVGWIRDGYNGTKKFGEYDGGEQYSIEFLEEVRKANGTVWRKR